MASIFLGPIVFWTMFGSILGFAFGGRTPRRLQILIGAALYLGFCYYDYFIANPPGPGGMAW